VAEGDEVLGGRRRGLHVVHVDQARRHAAHLLEEHERIASALELEEVRQVGAAVEHGGDHQPVDLAGMQQLDGAPFGVVVPLGAGDEQRVAAPVGDGARTGDDPRVVGVVASFTSRPSAWAVRRAVAAPAPVRGR
jgi:hypothetical protein